MRPGELVTLTMRELDRLKVIQAVAETGLKPGRAAERLGLALTQMDVVTQQNAAFVGESAAAAASLAERARSLNMLIAAFKVERATGIGPGGYRT